MSAELQNVQYEFEHSVVPVLLSVFSPYTLPILPSPLSFVPSPSFPPLPIPPPLLPLPPSFPSLSLSLPLL